MRKRTKKRLIRRSIMVAVLVAVTIAAVFWRIQQDYVDVADIETPLSDAQIAQLVNESENPIQTPGAIEFCEQYSAIFPNAWLVYQNDAERSDAECLIRSYLDSSPLVPEGGHYPEGLEITISSETASATLQEILAGSAVKAATVGTYNAVVDDGKLQGVPTSGDRYRFIVNDQLYTITGVTTNTNLKRAYQEFIDSFSVL